MNSTQTLDAVVGQTPVRTLKAAHKALGLRGDFDRLFSPKTSRYAGGSYQANWALHLATLGVTPDQVSAAISGVPQTPVQRVVRPKPVAPAASPLPPVPAPSVEAPAAPQTPSEAAPSVAHLAPVVSIPARPHPVKRTVADVFGFQSKAAQKAPCTVWNDPSAPAVDPLYLPDEQTVLSAVAIIEAGLNFWAFGPAGTGKTEFVRWLCGKLGRAFVRVSFDAAAERYELIGGERVRSGSTVWQDGVVLRGIQHPGAVILLDEVSFGRPEYLSALHGLLEPNGVFTRLEDGTQIRRAAGVVFCAADNSNGRGDASGVYDGIRVQNQAFLTRFAAFLEFGYLPQEREVSVIVSRTGCNAKLAEQLVAFVNVCRAKVQTSDLDVAPGLRELMALSVLLSAGVPAELAFQQALMNRASNEVRESLRALWVANVDVGDLEKAAR